jgi:hypothetical protein
MFAVGASKPISACSMPAALLIMPASARPPLPATGIERSFVDGSDPGCPETKSAW